MTVGEADTMKEGMNIATESRGDQGVRTEKAMVRVSSLSDNEILWAVTDVVSVGYRRPQNETEKIYLPKAL